MGLEPKLLAVSPSVYYGSNDVEYAGLNPVVPSTRPSTFRTGLITVVLGLVSLVVVFRQPSPITTVGLLGGSNSSRLYTWDLSVSKGNNRAQGGVTWGQRPGWYLNSQARTGDGRLAKLKLTKRANQSIEASADLALTEDNSAIKIGIVKPSDKKPLYRVGVVTSNQVTLGSDSSSTGSSVLPFRVKQPVVLSSQIGMKQGATNIKAGIIASQGQLKAAAGIEGGSEGNYWRIGVESGTRDRPLIWKAQVNTENWHGHELPMP